MPAITLSTLFQTLYHFYNFYLLLFSLLHWKVCIFNCHEHIFLYDVEHSHSNTSASMAVVLTRLTHRARTPFSEKLSQTSSFLSKCSHSELWHLVFQTRLKANHDVELYPSCGTGQALPLDGRGYCFQYDLCLSPLAPCQNGAS